MMWCNVRDGHGDVMLVMDGVMYCWYWIGWYNVTDGWGYNVADGWIMFCWWCMMWYNCYYTWDDVMLMIGSVSMVVGFVWDNVTLKDGWSDTILMMGNLLLPEWWVDWCNVKFNDG